MSPLHWFLLRILLWLPVCFAAWYFLSILFAVPLASATDTMLGVTVPDLIESVSPNGNSLLIVTRLAVSTPAHGSAAGELLFELDPLKYGYSLPLYTALVLATPDADWPKALKWGIGVLILFAVQLFGIAAETLKVLAFEISEDARNLLGLSDLGYEGLVLAYQFGYLILAPVAPLVVWLGQYRMTLPVLMAQGERKA